MRVRTERDKSEKRRNDTPPCKLGDDAQLAHFESEPRRHRDDPPSVTEAGSESTIQVDSAESSGMGKGVDASGHLGRPSFGLSGLGRLAEIYPVRRTGSAIGVRLVGATQKPNGLTMGDRENCSDWHQIISLNAASVRILACSWSLRETTTYTATAPQLLCVSSYLFHR
jgi:hypothetical protein